MDPPILTYGCLVLHLLPIDLHVISISVQRAIRLKKVDLWKQLFKVHGSIFRQLNPYFSELRADLCIRKLKFEGRSRAIFLSRQDCNKGKICCDASTSDFTNRFKLKSGFSLNQPIYLFPKHCRILKCFSDIRSLCDPADIKKGEKF